LQLIGKVLTIGTFNHSQYTKQAHAFDSPEWHPVSGYLSNLLDIQLAIAPIHQFYDNLAENSE